MGRTRIGYSTLGGGFSKQKVKDEDDADDENIIWLYEDPSLVLLGGEVWPAAWVVAHYLEHLFQSSAFFSSSSSPSCCSIIELGAGAGLCGVVAAATAAASSASSSCQLVLTDESPELAELNVKAFKEDYLRGRPTEGREGEEAEGRIRRRRKGEGNVVVKALTLEWGDEEAASKLMSSLIIITTTTTSASEAAEEEEEEQQRLLLVIGCELTPMTSTHEALCKTLVTLLLSAQSSSSSSSDEEEKEKGEGIASALAVFTIDACQLLSSSSSGYIYPRTCPLQSSSSPCAGHRFLSMIGSKGLIWDVQAIYRPNEVMEICQHHRRGPALREREFAVTATDGGLVLVHIYPPSV